MQFLDEDGLNKSITRIDGGRVNVWIRGYFDQFQDMNRFVADLDAAADDIGQVMDIVRNCTGQFALAVVCENLGKCYLIADPIGAEPIYYLSNNELTGWAFRVKDLLPKLKSKSLDLKGLDESMLYRWLNEENTMVDGVLRVNPAEIIELSVDGVVNKKIYKELRYELTESDETEESVIEKTDAALDRYFLRLRQAYSRVAVMLSGGVDSSLLLAKAREFSFERLIAITCKFDKARNIELDRAQRVADELGVDLRVVEVDDEYVFKNFSKIVELAESPNAYFNCIARLKMMEAIADEVDLVIVGEGADGMFSMEVGGGSRALQFERKRKLVNPAPIFLRNGIANILEGVANPRVQRLRRLLSTDSLSYLRTQGEAFPESGLDVSITEVMPILKSIRSNRKSYFYSRFEPKVDGEMSENFVIGFCQNRGLFTQNRHQYYCYSVIGFGLGLKLAAPFLSKDIMDIGLALPFRLRSDAMGAKPVLKKMACRYISRDIVYAPKMGFETPLDEWLVRRRDNWMSWVTSAPAQHRGIFDMDKVASLDPHRDSIIILSAIMLELFCRQFIDG